MGPGGISIWQLFLIFLIFVLAVATLPLRHGSDASASMPDDEKRPEAEKIAVENAKTRRRKRKTSSQ